MRISGVQIVPGFGPHVEGPVDIDVQHGRIASIQPHQLSADDASPGLWIMPGLWDAHVHFSTHALVRHCPSVAAEATQADVLDFVAQSDTPFSVIYGFRTSTWDTVPTAEQLDAARKQPTVLISGDLHAVWLNTLAAEALGAAAGFLVEHDAFAVMNSVFATQPEIVDAACAAAMLHAAAKGVVGIVDFDSDLINGAWLRRASSGPLDLRVVAASYPADLDQLLSTGWHGGEQLTAELSVGPLKIIADGSMSSKTAFCFDPYPTGLPEHPCGQLNYDHAELLELMRRAHHAGHQLAVHAIGDRAAQMVLDAFAATGATGSIEHAQLLLAQDLPRFAELGVAASVQPAHFRQDQASLPQLWPTAHHRAFPLRSLADHGAQLRLGSDAPVADLDPWLAIECAVTAPAARQLSIREALAASVRTQVQPGDVADLILLDRNPLDAPGSPPTVLCTWLAGRCTYRDSSTSVGH